MFDKTKEFIKESRVLWVPILPALIAAEIVDDFIPFIPNALVHLVSVIGGIYIAHQYVQKNKNIAVENAKRSVAK